ncbi:prepilin-type N-terminal cleavage/methylation domain-containing protein [Vibrio sp. 03-59-1]|uniref:prepilin-type N-terminal cleavage/methylation domain-containing protein n=1 Tax=Vibrio sp. 03-59-1 TaxID=2607607 RepID=UPI0014939663|nr:prepilin-type N-terminal cleavage/methylation domain-containing protein [Vibrio sp. 03-59-1]NOH83631.1 prepilin-type N-terminal cleavage/methylation domain-containing protein [Vibrio sp. 03-59-1]
MRGNRLGFTLIELIVVIILIGIVSSYAASRYVGVGSFSTYAAQEQIISVIRQIQLTRMQANNKDLYGELDKRCNDVPPPNKNLKDLCLRSQLTIQSATAKAPACVGSSSGCSASGDTRSDSVRSDELTYTTVPNVDLIRFDLLGNPTGAASNGITINITANGQSTSVCINRIGYVGRGTCS